jgi:ATP-dependent Lhr-like helicase
LPDILAVAEAGLAAALSSDPGCGGRIVRVRLPGASEDVLAHAERLKALIAEPAAHIAEWLRREAAVSRGRVSSLFGISGPDLDEALGDLVEAGIVVEDLLVDGSAAEAVIDVQNLEILLRRARAAARPTVAARPVGDLARLVLALQGLGSAAGEGPAAVSRALASLEGAAIPAALWETEILPARVMRYKCADLDAALSSSPWQWFGAGRGLVSIAEVADLELFLPRGALRRGSHLRSSLIPEGAISLDFWAIRDLLGLDSSDTARELWAEAWKGLVASDSFRDLREGIASGFGAGLPKSADREPAFGSPRKIPRALRERWRGGAPVPGRWFALDLDEGDGEGLDALDELALDAARVRTLAARYGLLCRGILEREMPGLRWGDLFPAMRRLELSGELLAGRFFEGLEGPQFLDPAAFAAFAGLGDESEGGPLWINALDPAANALYGAAERASLLPQRVAANRICLDSGKILALSLRSYRELTIVVPAEDRRVPSILGLYASARRRDARAEGRIVVDSVNGGPAALSRFADALRVEGFEPDRGRMVLW